IARESWTASLADGRQALSLRRKRELHSQSTASYQRQPAEALALSRRAIHLPQAGVGPTALLVPATAPTGTIRAHLLTHYRAISSARLEAPSAQWLVAWHASMLLQSLIALRRSLYSGAGRLWSVALAIGAPICRYSKTLQPLGKNTCNFAWMASTCSTIRRGAILPLQIQVRQAA